MTTKRIADALRAVLAVSDRKTDVYDEAHAALEELDTLPGVSDWIAGDVYQEIGHDYFTAGIDQKNSGEGTDGVWSHRIECYGVGETGATTLRDLVLSLLAHPASGEAVAEVVRREPYLDGSPNPMRTLKWSLANCEDDLPVGSKLYLRTSIPVKVVDENDASIHAIQFALTGEDGLAFLRCWNEGNFAGCRREWPEAPAACYAGADPLAAAPGADGEVAA